MKYMIEKTGMIIPGAGLTKAISGRVASVGDTAGGGFADLVRDAAQGALNASRGMETQSLKAAAKDAEIIDVVTAVANAEITLETVMTVRDRVVQAYQEIMKMLI
jgi:flagellar hook-basal body complex protein FliE